MFTLLAKLEFQQSLAPQGLTPFIPREDPTGLQAASTIEQILSTILTVLTIIGGIMFAVNFLVGGLNWITAGGDQSKVDKAKKMLTNAGIGIIVVSLSYIIASIVSAVTGIDFLNLTNTLQKLHLVGK